MCIKLDGKAIDHIAHMANEFFSAAVHGEVDNSVDHDNPASDPADNDSSENEDQEVDDQPEVANDDPAATHNEDSAEPVNRPSYTKSPIFAAFARGSKN